MGALSKNCLVLEKGAERSPISTLLNYVAFLSKSLGTLAPGQLQNSLYDEQSCS